MKDKIKFKEFMVGLGELYDKEISRVLLDIYWKALEPFNDDECAEAFNSIIASCKFFPKPADFLEMLGYSPEERALKAWLAVDETVKRIGPYQSVKFQDKVIHSVIQSLGGWAKFQNCKNVDWKWREREFRSRYKTMANQEEHPDYLAGQFEIQNGGQGFGRFIEPPVEVRQLKSGAFRMIEAPRCMESNMQGNQIQPGSNHGSERHEEMASDC
jgi:uncharacterized protein DUF6475